MSEQESLICLMLKQNQSFFLYRIQSKENFFYKKGAFKGKEGAEDWTKNKKKAF